MSIVGLNVSTPVTVSALPTDFAQVATQGRLYRHINGSLEVLPKSPAEVFGERVLRPLIDKTYSAFQLVKQGAFALDGMLLRALNILPTASAKPLDELSTFTQKEEANDEKSDLEACVGAPLEQVIKITIAGAKDNDPRMLEAAHKVFSPFFAQCFSDDTYRKMEHIHTANMNKHETESKLLEAALEKCEQDNQGKKCYKHTQISKMPVLEKITTKQASEWKAIPGYYCWSVWVDRWMWIDKIFASGGYNCDIKTNKPTV